MSTVPDADKIEALAKRLYAITKGSLLMTIPTIGGRPSTGETFTKLLYHLDEIQELCAVMAHLNNTESGDQVALHVKGWLAMAEMFKLTRHNVVELAKGKLLRN